MNVLQEKILTASDLIALLLVFTTVLFDIRYSQIQTDLRKGAPSGPIALRHFRDDLIQSLVWKSIPLFLINAAVFYLFLPLLYEIITTTKLNLWRFDFVISAFVFVALAELLFAIWSAFLSIKLIQRIREVSTRIRNETHT